MICDINMGRRFDMSRSTLDIVSQYGLSIAQSRCGGRWIVSNGLILCSSYENLEDTNTEFYIIEESLEDAVANAAIKYEQMEAFQ